MVKQKKLMKTTWYAQPHDMKFMFHQTLESATHKNCIDIPLIRYNEALGAPMANHTHPEHADFASKTQASCFPDSTIGQFFCQLEISMTKTAFLLNIPTMKFGVQVIALAFLEDLNPIDEVSGLSLEAMLGLEHETTNRQSFSLYNGTDALVPYTGSTTLNANDDEGLTTGDLIETTDFNIDQFYDMIQYSSLKGKLTKVQSGIRWYQFTGKNPKAKKIRIHLKSSTKRMNEYASLIVRVIVPLVDTTYQAVLSADTNADDAHIQTTAHIRFNEWNEFFDFSRTG